MRMTSIDKLSKISGVAFSSDRDDTRQSRYSDQGCSRQRAANHARYRVVGASCVTTRNAIIAISPLELAAAITLPPFVIARSASRVTSAS